MYIATHSLLNLEGPQVKASIPDTFTIATLPEEFSVRNLRKGCTSLSKYKSKFCLCPSQHWRQQASAFGQSGCSLSLGFSSGVFADLRSAPEEPMESNVATPRLICAAKHNEPPPCRQHERAQNRGAHPLNGAHVPLPRQCQ